MNHLCRCTRNPTKLAYCRLFFCDLSHAIYSKSNQLRHDEREFTCVVAINDSERRVLMTEKMFTYCGFLRGQSRDIQLNNCNYALIQAKIIITVPCKTYTENYTAGYTLDEHHIVLNPGTYFEITECRPT